MGWGVRRGPRLLVLLLVWVGVVVLAPATAQASVWVDDTPSRGWGVDGRVYATVVVGDTVIVGGSFAQAVSPTGATVARKNLAAFSLATGELLSGWRADAGAAVRALVTDGAMVWVGGSFSKLGGAEHVRLARLEAATGAVDPAFTASADGTVRALALDGQSVYAGGAFLNANGAPRTRLAKFAATTGVLDATFQGSASDLVMGLVRNPQNNQLYVSGRFRTLGGAARNGVGAVSSGTGAVAGTVFASAARPTLGLAVNPSGTRLFGAGGSGSNAAAAWNTTNGVRTWRQVTDGDIQAIAYYDNTVYFGFHDGYQADATIKLLAADADTGVLQKLLPPLRRASGAIFAISPSPTGGWSPVVTSATISGVPPGLRPLRAPSRSPARSRWCGATSTPRHGGATGTAELAADELAELRLRRHGLADRPDPARVRRRRRGHRGVYGGDPAARYVTTYFRRHFTVSAMPQSLNLQLLADDGAVVYLNGVEVVRDNMPGRPTVITNTTPASTNRVGGPENAFRPFSLNPALLRSGDATCWRWRCTSPRPPRRTSASTSTCRAASHAETPSGQAYAGQGVGVAVPVAVSSLVGLAGLVGELVTVTAEHSSTSGRVSLSSVSSRLRISTSRCGSKSLTESTDSPSRAVASRRFTALSSQAAGRVTTVSPTVDVGVGPEVDDDVAESSPAALGPLSLLWLAATSTDPRSRPTRKVAAGRNRCHAGGVLDPATGCSGRSGPVMMSFLDAPGVVRGCGTPGPDRTKR